MNQIVVHFNMVQRYETINYLRTEHLPVYQPLCLMHWSNNLGWITVFCILWIGTWIITALSFRYRCFFNSSGSFFDFFPTSGSFVAHLIVQQDVIQMFAHMIGILQGSSQPLSFFVFAPIFDTFDQMRNSAIASFMVRSVIIQRGKHMLSTGIYFRGTNSNQSLQEVNFLPNNDSGCYWLQNASGRQQWPVTDDRVNKVISSFPL